MMPRKTNPAHQKEARLLLLGGRPAKALRDLMELSAPRPINQYVSTAELQAQLPRDDHLAHVTPSLYTTRVLFGLLEQGLIARPAPGQWRLTGEGIHMVRRMAEAAAIESAPRAKPLSASQKTVAIRQALGPCKESQAEQAPIVKAPCIDRLSGSYDKDECNFRHVRAGALDFRDLPSRRGNMLVYRDGRQEPITHGAAPVQRPRPAQVDLQPVAPASTAAANDAPAGQRKARA
ncbi:hypothetical protein LNV47_22585 [Paucibacter sp. DJ4R-1]|nr:hypothetical protein [Paucibacter sp. DJ4R-1]